MRRLIVTIVVLAACHAGGAAAQTAGGTPSAQEIQRALTRGIVVPEAPGPQSGQAQGTPAPTTPTMPAQPPSVDLTVTFATGSVAITPAGERVLAELGQALASPELTRYRFRIEGHTDTVGDARMNQGLSERRAAAVATWLISRYRIAPDRLEAVGLGESALLIPTPDNTPELRNRRVRVVNLGG